MFKKYGQKTCSEKEFSFGWDKGQRGIKKEVKVSRQKRDFILTMEHKTAETPAEPKPTILFPNPLPPRSDCWEFALNGKLKAETAPSGSGLIQN